MATAASTKILRSVRQFARQHDLLRPGPIVLAVSGGTDSTALALILAQLREELGLVLYVAHFDHRTRPRAAAADAAFVGELANHVGATLRVGRAETAPRNEDEARRDRYAYLRRVAADVGATAIATGHTKDDQAETVLLHLVRGAGIEGLAGMRPERDGVVRPLLRLTRADTTLVCRGARIAPREDPTNRSLRFARNRIRHRVLPELAKLNGEVTDAIARLADAAATVAQVERGDADAALDAALVGEAVALTRLPDDPAVRERALVLWWERRTGRRLGARHRAALGTLAADTRGSKTLDLPGGRALREYDDLSIAETQPAEGHDGPIRLERGRTIEWHGWRLALDAPTAGAKPSRIASTEHGVEARGRLAGGETARIAADVATRLVVRARRPGDRLAGPRGAKVQDVFTDAKVPARQREVWPLVTLDDEVLWIPGVTPPPRSGGLALEVHRIAEKRAKATVR